MEIISTCREDDQMQGQIQESCQLNRELTRAPFAL